MIQWIKNLFKKEEQTVYDLEQWKMQNGYRQRMNLEKEIYEIYRRAMNETSLYPDQTVYDLERWKIQNDYWQKMNLEKELYEIYRRAMNETRLYPDQTHIPSSFIYYVDKCIEYGQPLMALKGIERLNWHIQGTNINLEPLKQKVYNTKEYKEYLVQKKLKEIEEDFK